jgi:nucleoside-diphosphate-sugar epimerase
MKKRILLTGATGFLGSHIAKVIIKNDIELIALKRENSDLYRCKTFKNKINWIIIDIDGFWKETIVKLNPTHIIHSAWSSVNSNERNDLSQIENLDFLKDLLEVSKAVKLNQFIGFGSQAEYGILKSKVREEEVLNPVSIYGSTKVAVQKILKTFCELNQIEWIWLRLFSFTGEYENNNWLIPFLVNSIINEKSIDMTLGEQKYSYMYVNDFASIILKIITSKVDSGIYNISAENALSVMEISNLISKKLNILSKINWGALPYRLNQSMHIEGDTLRLKKQIGHYELTGISEALDNVILNYKNQ